MGVCDMGRPRESPPVSLDGPVCNHAVRHGDGRQEAAEKGEFGNTT